MDHNLSLAYKIWSCQIKSYFMEFHGMSSSKMFFTTCNDSNQNQIMSESYLQLIHYIARASPSHSTFHRHSWNLLAFATNSTTSQILALHAYYTCCSIWKYASLYWLIHWLIHLLIDRNIDCLPEWIELIWFDFIHLFGTGLLVETGFVPFQFINLLNQTPQPALVPPNPWKNECFQILNPQ